MPASIPIARRSGVVSAAVSVAGALLLLACSASPITPQRAADEGPPAIDLSPADGTVRTTVPAPAPAPAPSVPTVAEDGNRPGDVLLVGDSVLVLVLDDLAGRLRAPLRVDGADCRQLGAAVSGPCGGVPTGIRVDSGIDAVGAARAGEGTAPGSAVFVLANNASITRTELDAAMTAADGIDHVWWVNTRIEGFGRQDPNNRLLAELVDDDPRAGLVDWFAASEGQDWLADNVHPNDEGQEALAALIEERLRCRCTA